MYRGFPPAARSRRAIPALVLAIAASAIVAVWLGYFHEARKERARAIDVATARLESVAQAMAEQAERSLTGINIASLYLRNAWTYNRHQFDEIVETLRPVSVAGQNVNVMINDVDGWMRFSTYPPAPNRVNFADREHFRAQATSSADTLFISQPVMGKISKRIMIPCSRKILDENGAFNGIAVIAAAPEDLLHIDEHMDIGPRGGAALVGLDRVVRASITQSPGAAPEPGLEVPADLPYLTQAQGSYRAIGIADGEPRLFAFRQLRQFPMAVVVSEVIADVEATTRPHLTELALFAAIASVLIGGFAGVVAQFIFALSARNQAVEAARRRSDLILASAGEGICGFDADGRITFLNPAARAMLGWDEADAEERLSLAAQLRELNDGHDGTRSLKRTDGGELPVEVTAGTMPAAGDALHGTVMVLRDVSRTIEAEQALIAKSNALARSNAELEQFAYVASHDLREPLRMVSSFLGLLERRLGDGIDSECKEFLAFARDGAQRMDRLVLDLLEYSRIGRLQRPPTEVDLAAVMAEVRSNLAAALADTGGSISVATDLPVVNGDPGELTRLLQNLVGNALKYHAKDRPPVVLVGAEREDGHWRISVTDNGIGIAPENFGRIFGVFQRLHRRDEYEGTGIGLAICKKVVEHHGGTIDVRSEPGQGTTFSFTLPA